MDIEVNQVNHTKMIRADIALAKASYRADDFQLTNISGNRIMSDSLFGEKRYFALIGFFVKQTALYYLQLKARLGDGEFLNAKLIGEKYLDSLSDSLENSDLAELWKGFHQFCVQIERYFRLDAERAYEENPAITECVRRSLLRLLIDKSEVLFNANNSLLMGVVNELELRGRLYGSQMKDAVLMSCLISLDRYYNYFRAQYAMPHGEINRDEVKKTIFPYLAEIDKLVSANEIKYDDVTDLLWRLIKGWRELFVCYSELPSTVVQRPVELPEESKKKLSEVIGKALQKELKPQGR